MKKNVVLNDVKLKYLLASLECVASQRESVVCPLVRWFFFLSRFMMCSREATLKDSAHNLVINHIPHIRICTWYVGTCRKLTTLRTSNFNLIARMLFFTEFTS